MDIKGVIFDLDGVICSTDEYHYLAWKELADSLGLPFDREVNSRMRGVSRMDSLEILLEGYRGPALSRADREALAARKNRRYRALLCRMTPADLSPEVRETLEALRAGGLRLAIGSSSKNAPFILERVGLSGWFDGVVDGSCIARAKPDPEVFLRAAALLGLSPARCLVVEDAAAGAQAGHAGGFTVACVGDAARAGAGDFNLTRIGQLRTLLCPGSGPYEG